MSVWSRLASVFRAAPNPNTSGMVYGLPMVSGKSQRRGTAELIELFNKNPTLRAVVGKISQNVASAGWKVYRRNGSVARDSARAHTSFRTLMLGPEHVRKQILASMKRSKELTEMVDHPFQVLMRKPNPFMLGVDLVEVVQTWLDIKAEAFIVKARNPQGQLVELWPVPPHWVTEVPDGERLHNFRIAAGTWRDVLPPEDVMWLKLPNPSDPYGRPQGFADALADEFDTDEASAEYTKGFFRNRGKPDALIALTNVTKSEQVTEVQEKWDALNRGVNRGHRVHFAGGEMEVHEFGQGFKDASVSELRAFERDIVRETYGVSPEIFGKLNASNRATITQALRILAITVIMPRLERLRLMLQDQCMGEWDDRSLLDYVSPIPEDREFQLEIAKAFPWVPTLNELRTLAEWPEIDNGDVRMLPFTAMPVAADQDLTAMFSPRETEDAPAEAETPAATGAATDVQATALNGAQIEALIGVLVAVAMGNLPRDSAIELLQIAFQLTPEQAEAVMGDIGIGFKIEAPEVAAANGDEELPPAKMEEAKAIMAKCLVMALRKNGHEAVWQRSGAGFNACVLRRDIYRAGSFEIEAAISALRAERIAAEINPIWEEEVGEWMQDAAEAVGYEASMTALNPFVESHVKDLELDRIKGLVDKTTKEQLRYTMAEGVVKGESSEQIAARVEAVFEDATRVRARAIARTEVGRSANYANRTAWQVSGVVESRDWVATADDRTRESHENLDGENKPLNEPWTIGALSADYPGDFGAAEEDVNCRCAEAPRTSDASDVTDEEIDALLEDEDGERSRKAVLRVARAYGHMTKDQRVGYWRALQQQLMPWENKATRALKRGFAKQREDVLAAIR